MHELATMAKGGQTMSSREIAELIGSRHDSVKRTIERLTEKQVIRSTPLVDFKNSNNVTGTEYIFTGEQGKRDSIVVVAQLSPEFTAALVDRWQELESGAAQQPALPQRSQAREIVEDGMAIAALFEVPKHYAQIVVTKEARRVTGVDYAPLLLKAPAQDCVQDDEVMLEPTELAARLGWKDGAEANRKLAAMGLQKRHKGHWSTTRKGDELAQRHSWSKGEKSGYNYKWNLAGIKDLLAEQ